MIKAHFKPDSNFKVSRYEDFPGREGILDIFCQNKLRFHLLQTLYVENFESTNSGENTKQDAS